MKKVRAVILAATAAVFFLPGTAQAWDLRGASTAADCHHVYAHIDANSSNPRSADARLRVQINGGAPFFEQTNYSPARQDFVFGSRIPQNGGSFTVRTSLIDHDGDEVAVNTTNVGQCGPPAAPPVTPPAPPAPPVTPPTPPAPPKVCVPSGTEVALRKTGNRSFLLDGKAKKIRWRFAGEKLPRLNNQKSVDIPGNGTGRVVVRFRANCAPGKLVAEILPPRPPETVG